MATALGSNPLTFKDLTAILWRRRIPAAAAFFLVALAVLAASHRVVPLYQADGAVAIDRSRKALEYQNDPQFAEIEYSLLNTQRELMTSRPVLERAYAESRLAENASYAHARDPIDVLRNRLKVTTNRDSWVIQASVKDEDPARAERALQSVLDNYLSMQAERQAKRSSGAVSFLTDQVRLGRVQLDQAREHESSFRAEAGIQSADAENNHLAVRQRELNQQRIELERRIAGDQSVLDQLAEADQQGDADAKLSWALRVEAVAHDPVVVEQRQQLYALQAQHAALAEKYLENHPRILESERQIATKHEQFAQAVATARASLAANQTAQRAQYADIDKRGAAVDLELATYRSNLQRLSALGEETASIKKIYEHLLERMHEEEVASRLSVQNVSVVNNPRSAIKPVNVSLTLSAALALVLGAVAATAAALLGESLDRRIRGVEGAQELTGLPALGTVPQVGELVPLGRGGDADKPLVVAEAYRGLRASLHLVTRRQDRCQCLAVCSSAAGEGKSTVATRLAISLASAGNRVLLIDGDMRKPTLHHQLGEAQERGLSFLLAGYHGIEPLPSSYANLDFLGVGVRPPNPSELLHSPAFGLLLDAARSKYSYVIIDTPPLGLVSDALVVGEMVDGVLLVLRDRFTTKGILRRTLERLQPIHDKLLGFVLNGERVAGQGAYYYGYRYAVGKEPVSGPLAPSTLR